MNQNQFWSFTMIMVSDVRYRRASFFVSFLDFIKQEILYFTFTVDAELFGDTPCLSLSNLIELSYNVDESNISSEETLVRKTDLGLVLYTSGSTGIPKGNYFYSRYSCFVIIFPFSYLNTLFFLIRCTFATFNSIESSQMAMGKVSIFINRNDWCI